MDLWQAISYSMKVSGWYEEDELEALWKMCRESVHHHGILEVGCFAGRTSSLLAQFLQTLLPPAALTFIDPFLSDSMKGYDMVQTKAEFSRCLREIGTPYRLVEKRTIDVTPAELPERIDFLHIDGDHTKTAVETDCRLLLPLVRPGGIACFHDYGRRAFDVTNVVDRMCADWRLIGTFGTVRALQKDQDEALRCEDLFNARVLWA
jgi:predicted O-methyltransferase YrrM